MTICDRCTHKKVVLDEKGQLAKIGCEEGIGLFPKKDKCEACDNGVAAFACYKIIGLSVETANMLDALRVGEISDDEIIRAHLGG